MDIAPVRAPITAPTMGYRLLDRVAVVTGGGTGVGRAVAITFAKEGAKVFILGRRVGPLQEVKEEWNRITSRDFSLVGTIIPITCDVSDSSSTALAFASVLESTKKIHILVNCAGVNIGNRHSEVLTTEDWSTIININLNGTFNCIHQSLPHMRKQGEGLIVNVSSVAGLRGLPLAGSAYCASKAAVNALGSTIAAEQWEHNIRVCNFCPGEINTPLIDERAVPPSPEARAKMLQPQDCADALLMVAVLPSRAQVSEIVIKPTVQQFWL
eukprot:TRINITY_DN1854_c0_g1_i4.p1 TRINITY_DN1854_c0_g1~~TRINITY_DN1854_c0_g1_i4.p1  ORF type:complete len:269 (+),score=61.83 TRINITY_DN1854_c0_g1_i4:698-1504(+)